VTHEQRPDSKTPVPSSPRDLSEDNVRARIRNGDIANATATALLLHGAEVFAFLAGVLDDPEAARDVHASFCDRVGNGLGRFGWTCCLRTWMYAVARGELARHREGPRLRARDRDPGAANSPPPLSQPPMTAPAPTPRTMAREAVLALRRHLAPEEREIFILRFDRELPWREIALAFLGGAGSEGAIEAESQHLQRRFQEMRRRLAKIAAERGLPSPLD
jgi:DNA-directed RNA polymerase specialized sigma24 family protein